MGQGASKKYKEDLNAIAKEPEAKGYWLKDIKTGTRFVTPPITSGPDVIKKPNPGSLPGLPSEIWGPYKKTYVTSGFGQKIFRAPESVDGVPILTACADMLNFLAMTENHSGIGLQAQGALMFGSHPPACWMDKESPYDPLGGLTFDVVIRHPSFYTHAAQHYAGLDPIFGGRKKTRRSGRKSKKYTRRQHLSRFNSQS